MASSQPVDAADLKHAVALREAIRGMIGANSGFPIYPVDVATLNHAAVASGLHMRFGNRVVLEDISLMFPDRKFTGIMGPNGAGKTTSFNVLTGRYRPHRGRVLLDGEDITGLAPRAIARKGVARSFQTMNLFNDFSAFENVALAVPENRARGLALLAGTHKDSAAADKAHLALDRVGLGAKGDIPAKSLSYGDRRALEIGIALASEPGVLCLDEPTSGLGREATARLADLVRSLKGTLTIIAIEHDMEFLFGLADGIAVIHWGQVIARGTPAELRDDPWVKNSNLGKLQ
jgi:branched-chain amino acid transport system ATP-binding protein